MLVEIATATGTTPGQWMDEPLGAVFAAFEIMNRRAEES